MANYGTIGTGTSNTPSVGFNRFWFRRFNIGENGTVAAVTLAVNTTLPNGDAPNVEGFLLYSSPETFAAYGWPDGGVYDTSPSFDTLVASGLVSQLCPLASALEVASGGKLVVMVRQADVPEVIGRHPRLVTESGNTTLVGFLGEAVLASGSELVCSFENVESGLTVVCEESCAVSDDPGDLPGYTGTDPWVRGFRLRATLNDALTTSDGFERGLPKTNLAETLNIADWLTVASNIQNRWEGI